MHNGPVWWNVKVGFRAAMVASAAAISTGTAHSQSAAGNNAPQQYASLEVSSPSDESGDIVVTGSHITGVETASPALKLTAEQIHLAGQEDIGAALRSLPFNFNGGQNPGVMQGASGIANQNITSGSAANLRGLGPDATLTLVNGKRVAYNGFQQSVDVSSIPLSALSSVEVIPDGSSGLYGSDAVAGVVNILLRPDFEGISAGATIGSSTDGGGFLQQYDATGGARWATGGFMVAGQYRDQDNITSAQRSYTRYMPRPADLAPSLHQFSALVTAHQSLSDTITFSIDALYNNRTSQADTSPSSAAYRFDSHVRDESFAVAPSLTFEVGRQWTIIASGSISADSAKIDQHFIPIPSGAITNYNACYCNKAQGAELTASGPIFKIAGEAVKLAVGGGFRRNEYHSYYYYSGSVEGGERSSYFAYGEINAPIVSPSNAQRGINRLVLSAAARFEHNAGFGDIVTPKIGIIYAPTDDFELKGTWGRSFKAPTLLQQFQPREIYLYPASQLGGTSYPSTATVLEPYGGNPDLSAEKATTWTATIGFHPAGVTGFKASATYFEVHYRDRVVQPLIQGSALSNPAYAQFITLNPSEQEQAMLIAESSAFYNYAGTYDPTRVVAVADDKYTNVARQDIRGIDIDASYQFVIGASQLMLSGLASWLESSQLNSASAPVVDLAGYVFNPPSVRARIGATWSRGRLQSAVYVNYLGSVKDNRSASEIDGKSMTTADLSLQYTLFGQSGGRKSVDLSVSVLNVANAKPPYLKSNAPYLANYDSTNYSATGRFISGSLRVRW